MDNKDQTPFLQKLFAQIPKTDERGPGKENSSWVDAEPSCDVDSEY
jgi:hypothetical protein